MASGPEGDTLKQRYDWKLIGWCSFCAIAFNVLMTRGCDTQLAGFMVMMVTFVIFCIPFLPEDWLRLIIDDYPEGEK